MSEKIAEKRMSENTLTVPKKRKLSENVSPVGLDRISQSDRNEMDYFLSYADVELHRMMIEDHVRTSTYRDAIMNEAAQFIKDKVVADVGCGTGILSMFCAQAGARKVYAIDASQIALQAEQLININGFGDRITVVKGKAEEVELPENVDVIVSEWMGYMMLYEAMLPSVLRIRDKYLKPEGKMYPERAVLRMALAETPWITNYEENSFDFWVSLNHTYSLDMSVLAELAVSKYKDSVHVHMVPQEDVISLPITICDLDLYRVQEQDLVDIQHEFSLRSMGRRCLNSLVLWFDVWFPGGVKLSTSPDMEDTHWQNTVIAVQDVRVKQDSIVKGSIRIKQDEAFHRHLRINLRYSVDEAGTIEREYKMDDNCMDSD